MKKWIGIILAGLLIGFFSASVIAYPAGVGDAINNPWEAIQLTVYKIAGQDTKAAEIEERIGDEQSSVEKKIADMLIDLRN